MTKASTTSYTKAQAAKANDLFGMYSSVEGASFEANHFQHDKWKFTVKMPHLTQHAIIGPRGGVVNVWNEY